MGEYGAKVAFVEADSPAYVRVDQGCHFLSIQKYPIVLFLWWPAQARVEYRKMRAISIDGKSEIVRKSEIDRLDR